MTRSGKSKGHRTPLSLGCIFLALLFPLSLQSASLDLYGTFDSMGVIVTLDEGEDDDGDATAALEYRTGTSSYSEAFPLSRVTKDGSDLLIGSLFWLAEATAYDVRVTISDPDGAPLDGTVLEGSGGTRDEISVPAAANSYYVSTSGSDETGDGSPGNPFATLGRGFQAAYAGDEIVLREGVYYEGDISIPRSGAAGAPIVVRSYGGETAILDGSDPAAFTWTAAGGGVYSTTVNVAGTNLVAADGVRLFPYGSLSDLQNLAWDVPGFYDDGLTLYVRIEGDADPNGVDMAVSRYGRGIWVNSASYVYFIDLTFRYYGKGGYAKAIYLYHCSDNLVQGCTFAVNDLGIGIKYHAHRNVVQDCVFYDTVFDWEWGWQGEAGELALGINFYESCMGRGNVFRRNEFHDLWDGLGACPDWTVNVTNETDIYDNLFYNIADDGIETDGRCSNVRMWGNIFRDILVGISLAPARDGPVYALRNLFYRTGAGNNSLPGSPFKFNSGTFHSGPMFLFHNTSDAVLPGNPGLDIKIPGTWEQVYARNNIWAGTFYALDNRNTTQPIDLDYDVLWNEEVGDLAYWNGTRATLAALTAATGQEVHGLSAAPLFTNPSGGDYTLSGESSLISAGVVIPGINDSGDYALLGIPDIGAFEYTPYPPAGDIDGDGLPNSEEDSNMDGEVDAGETSPYLPDTDGDDYSDALETYCGGAPLDPETQPAVICVNYAPPAAGRPSGYCPDSGGEYSSSRGFGW